MNEPAPSARTGEIKEDAAAEIRHQRVVATEILEDFTPSERRIIIQRFKSMCEIPGMVGGDFAMPVYLGKPGGGWYWNYKENFVVVDPRDLLDKPPDQSRFIIAHEGSHRKISHANTESKKNKPFFEKQGFGFIYNALEDPRVNNFLADKYPTFRTGMGPLYAQDHGFEAETKELVEKSVGFNPRIMQVGFEYIRQWFAETRGEHIEIRESLDPEVIEAIEQTLNSAKRSWYLYPLWSEADDQYMVSQYAEAALTVIELEIWPFLEKLLEKDILDAMASKKLQEAYEDIKNGIKDPESLEGLPEDIKQQIKEQLEDLATQQDEKDRVQLDEIPKELLDKIRDYIESLPEEEKEKLREEAKKQLEDLEKEVSDKLRAKDGEDSEYEKGESKDSSETSETSESSENSETGDASDTNENAEDATTITSNEATKLGEPTEMKLEPIEPTYTTLEDIERSYSDEMSEAIKGTKEYYDELRLELEPIIDSLYNELNNILIARETERRSVGHRHGSRLNVRTRIREKASGVPVSQTGAWERRDVPTRRDYAFSLLIDLSGSMRVGSSEESRIHSALKTAVVWAEVLGRLGIKFEVTGFNSELRMFKEFSEEFGNENREKMAPMESEVETPQANYNDDGWAIDEASRRIETQKATDKFIIVISDGQPAPSYRHDTSEYDLGSVVERLLKERGMSVVGIGVQDRSVEMYYPDHVVIDDLSELPKAIADIIRRSIKRAV
jgi:cobalamin biosynthesis protein CobT